MFKFTHEKSLLWLPRILALKAIVLCTFVVGKSFASANDWEPQIYDYALPQRVVAIDKNKQQFYLFEKKSPLALKASYPCTTGQVIGDKQVVNDLRTPEGVYFVEYKIAKGLDFAEYGGVAYTLNYPNPVDRLRGKTGYGIWIHSKGNDADIIPNNTRGCIAIERKNILEVGPLLAPGTAVVVGESLNTSEVPMADNGTAKHLRFRMEQWTRAWASRSQKFFDFYDFNAYTRAMPGTFEAFRANKERLFKILSWINIFNREVHVLEGPGYWVTWSEQFYRAPNLTTEGVRRLYWQRFSDGQFRIVGMEWIPRNLGMRAAYKKGQLVASIEGQNANVTSSDAQNEKPIPPPLTMPEMTQDLVVVVANQGDDQQVAQIVTASKKINLDTKLSEKLEGIVNEHSKALQNRNKEKFFEFYNNKEFGKVENAPKLSFKKLNSNMQRFFGAKWIDMLSAKAKIEVKGDMVVSSTNKLIYMPNRQVIEGIERLYWKQGTNDKWLVVSSEWVDKKLGMEAAYLERISVSVDKFVQKWREDWLKGEILSYMEHYTSDAKQGNRNKSEITAQKKRLWSVSAPEKIELSGLRVQLDKRGVRADMMQIYNSTDGKGDRGTKTLILEPHFDGWKIVNEDWAALPDNN